MSNPSLRYYQSAIFDLQIVTDKHEGARFFLASRCCARRKRRHHGPQGKEAVAALQATGVKAFGRAVDQGDSEATKTFILDVAEEFGGIDAHISKATSTAESHSAEAWESAIAVDLMGAVNASKAVWPFLEAAAARYGYSSFLAISSNAASMSQRLTPRRRSRRAS